MNILIRNTLKGVKKRLFQYFGIALLLVVVIASITSLYTNSQRITSAFYKVAENSGEYDYRIAPQAISDYKEINSSLIEIKEEIKKQFLWVSDESQRQEIDSQIDSLTASEVQNNLLPHVDAPKKLNDTLLSYLLNWAVNYKTILINSILNNQIKDNEATKYYKFNKSYFKYFNQQDKSQNRFFNFEDAFYLNPLPPGFKPGPQASVFDFSPQRTTFNKVWIVEGKSPINTNEIIINPKFAKDNNIKLNDKFTYLPDEKLKVVGFGYTYWGITGERTIDNLNPSQTNTTQVFSTREWFSTYLKNNYNQLSTVKDQLLLKISNNDDYFANKLESIFNKYFNFEYGTLVNSADNDPRSGALKQTFNMQTIIFSSISLIVLFVAVFIVLSYVKKEISIQKKQIGLIKALGYNNSEISIGFSILILLITLISAILGFALGLPLQLLFNSLGKIWYFLPIPYLFFSLPTLLISIIALPIIFVVASYLQSMISLRTSSLTLIYDKPSNSSSRWVAFFKKPFNHWNFRPRLAISFSLKSFGKLALIFFIFIFVSFLLLFQSIATDIFDNKITSLYSYYNKDVLSYTPTISMYKTNSSGEKIQIYDWKYNENLDPNKKITAFDFILSDQSKINKLLPLLDNLKGYYFPTDEINLLYENTQPDSTPPGDPSGKTYKYMWPNGTFNVPQATAQEIAAGVTKFFSSLISYSSIDITKEKLPGISFGQNIINRNIYPNLKFYGSVPSVWVGHNQGLSGAKRISITSLYNNPSYSVNWKDWFNLKEENNRDIDLIFNSSHQLNTQSVTYIDNFGVQQTVDNCYVVPSAISKALATLNNYKYGQQFLNLINIDGKFIPIIIDIQAVIVNNLDTTVIYTNIDDIRTAIGYVDSTKLPVSDSFNNEFSKEQSILPLNYLSIAQPDNDYNFSRLKDTFVLIGKSPWIFSLIKKTLEDVFKSLEAIINITKYLLIFTLIFILIIIINMILDNNIMIIAMMKSFGYRINEINLLIIGSYIVALILAFTLGAIFSYVVWNIIVFLVGKIAATVFIVPINPITILVTFVIITAVMSVGYLTGLYLIKYRSVTSLLQGD